MQLYKEGNTVVLHKFLKRDISSFTTNIPASSVQLLQYINLSDMKAP